MLEGDYLTSVFASSPPSRVALEAVAGAFSETAAVARVSAETYDLHWPIALSDGFVLPPFPVGKLRQHPCGAVVWSIKDTIFSVDLLACIANFASVALLAKRVVRDRSAERWTLFRSGYEISSSDPWQHDDVDVICELGTHIRPAGEFIDIEGVAFNINAIALALGSQDAHAVPSEIVPDLQKWVTRESRRFAPSDSVTERLREIAASSKKNPFPHPRADRKR